MKVLTVEHPDGTEVHTAARGSDAVARALAAWRATMRARGGTLRSERGGTLYRALRSDGSAAAVLRVRDHPPV